MGDEERWKIWKEYFKDLHNVDKENFIYNICGFEAAGKGHYFYGTSKWARVSIKAASRDEVKEEMIKNGVR